MIFKIQIYTLRIREYYRESIEMKLTKRQFNISISLFILSLPLNYQYFLIILENSCFPDNDSHNVDTTLPNFIFP